MKRIYVSSTYEDLKDYRTAVADALRQCGYDVDYMEKYAARDDRPRELCEKDVAKCGVYIGILAWRYGYVPVEDNPDAKSITELEYLAAARQGKTRFIFLLSEEYAWPSRLRDADNEEDYGKRIRELRKRLQAERWVSFFNSAAELANKVLISVLQEESTKHVEDMPAMDEIRAVRDLGPSYLPNIQAQIAQSSSAEFVAVRLGPTPWWDTRLHLVAALCSDFTDISHFVILDEEGRFLVLVSPAELRRALAKVRPQLEMAYLSSCQNAQQRGGGQAVDLIIASYPEAVRGVFSDQDEQSIVQVVNPTRVRELGLKPVSEILEQSADESRKISNSEILRRQSPYLVLTQDGRVQGVIDRLQWASSIAARYMS